MNGNKYTWRHEWGDPLPIMRYNRIIILVFFIIYYFSITMKYTFQFDYTSSHSKNKKIILFAFRISTSGYLRIKMPAMIRNRKSKTFNPIKNYITFFIIKF